jgi:hypothetical protein
MKSTYYLLAILLLISSCGQGTTKTALKENTRIEEENTFSKAKAAAGVLFLSARQLFRMNAKKSETIKTDKGSRVTIPNDAFVYEATGEPVSGEVTVEFIEYETTGEIISSGIPMTYKDESGNIEQFESAGMFEISATQENQELALADGKTIKVELATDVDGNFNFYELDDSRKDWTLKDTDCFPEKNKYIDEQEKELERIASTQPVAPKKPVSYTKGDKLFDVKLYRSNDEVFEKLNGVMWKFSGSDPKNDPSLTKSFNEIYRLVYLEPSDTTILEYNLHFESLTDTVDIQAVPVFKGALMDKENDRIAAIFTEINKAIAAQALIRAELARERKLLRLFNVENLAVYNYDRQFKDPNSIGLIPDFVLADGKSSDAMNIFLIPTEKRVVVKYTPETKELFRINPKEKNKIVAISADNTIYYLSNKDIREMQLRKKAEGSKVEFVLKIHSEPIDKPEELDELLAKL